MPYWNRLRGAGRDRGRGQTSGRRANNAPTNLHPSRGSFYNNRRCGRNYPNYSNRQNNAPASNSGNNLNHALVPLEEDYEENPYLRSPSPAYPSATSYTGAENSNGLPENCPWDIPHTSARNNALLATCNVIKIVKHETRDPRSLTITPYFDNESRPNESVTKFFGRKETMHLPGYSEVRPNFPTAVCKKDLPYNIEFRNSDLNGLCGRCRCPMNNHVDIKLHLLENRKNCAKCTDPLEDFHYKCLEGWLCVNCAPSLRPCKNKNKGCTYEDINVKVWKHELYFCVYEGICNLCQKEYEAGTLYEHYRLHHVHETVFEGAKFRVKDKGPNAESPDINFLVLAEFGPTVCSFYLREGLFRIIIHSPLHFTELHKYKCVIEVSDPYWKTKSTYMVKETYVQQRDWFLYSNKNDFARHVQWTRKVDIAVRITRKVIGTQDDNC